jgi:CRISPR-associated endonuclease/helicase Cas3
MRTLVEQTEKEVHKWLDAHGLLWNGHLSTHAGKVGVHILMGGEDASEWDNYPEENAILIGTQDMLLSRALNRGYATGRARWPKDFALLNNDCLWVFDEVQLMSTGFATSLQLQAWRESQTMQPARPTFSWWMSATVEQEWLASAVDFVPSIARVWNDSDGQTKLLWNEDKKGLSDSAKRLKKLLQPATKAFHPKAEAELKSDKDGDEYEYIAKVAKAVKVRMAEHGGKTLVIMNTVRRARALAEKMKDNKPLLLHSRFRHRERKAWTSKVKDANFIIATQVIEAGLDITSRVLFSEICAWPSFIQRCGRAARYPDDPNADVYWLDVTKDSAPYPEDELAAVKAQLASLTDVSLDGFRKHRENLKQTPEVAQRLLPYAPRFVPRAKDILDLFDTTPDLTGADIDISRYIRDGEEHDITVFWRDCSTIPKGKNPPKAKAWQPEHAELCPVPKFSRDSGFRDFAQKTEGRIWRWDYRDGWMRLNRGDAERIFPGQVFLLEQSCGGYDPKKGWTGRAEDCDFDIGPWKQPVPPPAIPNEEDENTAGMGDDSEGSDGSSNSGQNGAWRTILQHSREVCEELRDCLAILLPNSDVDEDARVVLPLTGRLHDWGKAHAAFKQKVKPEELANAVALVPDALPAKAPDHCWRRDKLRPQPKSTPEAERDARRAGFRHELASGLAILELLRRHQPNHPALAWPDEELRAAFDFAPSEPCTSLAESALAAEIAALNVKQFNLLIYLVAAHHGKVRLSLRSSPDDLREDVPWPCPPETRQARGVREGDSLPDVALPSLDFTSSQVLAPAVTLHLDVMDLGLSSAYGPAWRERTAALLTAFGPFRLAWYETLLRIADARASREILGDPKQGGDLGASLGVELREEPGAYGQAAALSPAERSLVADLVADGLNIQDKFRPEPLYKQTGKGHYESKTVEEIREAKDAKTGSEHS